MPVDKQAVRPETPAVTIGRAVRRLRGDVTQSQLADAIGTTQATISRWESEKDLSVPSFDEIDAIERHLDLARGAILVAAGLVKVGPVEAALLADNVLDPQQLTMLLDIYRSFTDPAFRHGVKRR